MAIMNRIGTIVCPILLVVLPVSAEGNNCRIWNEQPAGSWVKALPLGNGRLGGVVFGGVAGERLQLNEESLWAGEPVDSCCTC
jgi:alpha-L-fucosidase 2